MSHFDYLRVIPWYPSFKWVKTVEEAAHQINIHHEDYPRYIELTVSALRTASSTAGSIISNTRIQALHQAIFVDKPFKGTYRDVDVRVGPHHPPRYLAVADLMNELGKLYIITNIDDLIEWYKDFETIHPFQDGNGRVGGVIVAGHAHRLRPDRGWFAPEQ